MGIYVFLFAAGSSVGFLSGLLGLGGGIIMFPLLLYLTPALGLEPIGVKAITGLTMAQGFFASLSAAFYYKSEELISSPLVLTFGLSLAASSLAGSLLSSSVPDGSLLFVFAVLALLAAAMMFLPRGHARDETSGEAVSFSRPLAIGIGLVLGFFLGMVGQGGAFITIPVLLYVLRVPLRVALGSTLAIGVISAAAGLLGKAATAQVPPLMAAAMLIGAVPMARLGGVVSKRTDTRYLRWLLALVISGAALKIWLDVF
jgi:uncharacterized membrane protein YfcA